MFFRSVIRMLESSRLLPTAVKISKHASAPYREKKNNIIKVSDLTDSELRSVVSYRLTRGWEELDAILLDFWELEVNKEDRNEVVGIAVFLSNFKENQDMLDFMKGKLLKDKLSVTEKKILSFINTNHPSLSR